MLRVIYDEYKGYCVPKKSLPSYEHYDEDPVLTDGFDRFNWITEDVEDDSNDKNGKKKKSSSFYDIYNKPDTLEGKEKSMYEDESAVPMNHASSLTHVDITSPEVEEIPSLKIKKKRPSRKELREERKKSRCKGGQKANSKGYSTADFDGKSDPTKVKMLNNLYRELILTCGGNKIKTDEKLLQFFDISIYKEDLDDLRDDEWLSDNNISFIYEYLERYQLAKHDKLITSSIQLVRPSMVYLLANMPVPRDLIGVIPPIENSKFVFLPVNDNDDVETARAGSHWSLVVLSLLDQTALIFDTMDRANEVEAKLVIKKASEYLNMNFQVKVIDDTPQQINGSDCGIMVSQLTGYLLSRLLDLEYLKDHYVNFDVSNLKISAIDGRIFTMGTILNLVKHKRSIKEETG